MKTPKSPTVYRKFPTGFALALASLLITHSALATVYTVTTLADNQPNTEPVPGSLRDAIQTAQNGDSIVIAVSGTITLTGGELGINQNPLAITGPGLPGPLGRTAPAPMNLTISGNNSSRVFNIAQTGVVTIQNLTITGGLNQGANGGMNGNETPGAPGQGGGILNFGNLTLVWCIITGNSAIGGQFVNTGNGGNGGDGDGGGIYNLGILTLTSCTISNNSATGGQTFGGGENLLYQYNTSVGGFGRGGGIYNGFGELQLVNCTLSYNSANGANVADTAAGDIGGDGDGGGIYNVIGILTLVNCTLANNSASGGNAFVLPVPGFGVINPYGQSGNGNGGGIFSGLVPFALESCTLSLNTATGGNITPTYLNWGTAGNGSGGGIVGFLPKIENTIMAGNFVFPGLSSGPQAVNGATIGPDVLGPVQSGGFNLIGQTDGSFGWNPSDGNSPDQTGTTFRPLDPNLGPLQDNGGPTFTMALLETPGIPNPAVDQGNSFGLIGDQRGYHRPVNYTQAAPVPGDYSDIGAYELQSSSPSMSASPDSPTNYPFTTLAPSSTSIKLSWPAYLNHPTWFVTNPPAFGLQTLTVGTPFSPGNWTPFTGAIRYYNGNNQFVATDPIVPGPGRFYRLISPATNILFIPPAATTRGTSITSQSATLNGTTTPFGFNTLYWFKYGTDTNYGLTTATNSLTTTTNPAQLACLRTPISGLTGATLYHYQLVVTDDEGTQYGGDQTFEFGPPMVTTLPASCVTSNAAVLHGSVNPNGASTTVCFEYGLDTNYGYLTVSNNIGTVTQSDLTAAITNLSPGAVYHYRMDAFNANGVSYGADAAFTTIAPPTATTLTAESITTNSAVLVGSVNPTGDETTWAFQWGRGTNYCQSTPPLLMSPSSNGMVTVTYPITGLLPGTLYQYQIVATNSAGNTTGGGFTFTTQSTTSTN